MITVARFSYHDLTYMWSRQTERYVPRPSDGPQSMPHLFTDIQQQYERDGLEKFVRQFVLFPWSKEDVQEVCASMFYKRLSLKYVLNDHQGIQYIQQTKSWFFYEDMFTDIQDILQQRSPAGVPRLAEVRVYLD